MLNNSNLTQTLDITNVFCKRRDTHAHTHTAFNKTTSFINVSLRQGPHANIETVCHNHTHRAHNAQTEPHEECTSIHRNASSCATQETRTKGRKPRGAGRSVQHRNWVSTRGPNSPRVTGARTRPLQQQGRGPYFTLHALRAASLHTRRRRARVRQTPGRQHEPCQFTLSSQKHFHGCFVRSMTCTANTCVSAGSVHCRTLRRHLNP